MSLGEMVDARHRRDRLTAVDTVRDEHRVDEVRRHQAGLAHEPAQRVCRAQPAQASLGKGHGYRSGYCSAETTTFHGSTRQAATRPAVTYGSLRANSSICAGSTPRNTIAAVCGGSPSAPAITIRPASRWERTPA